MVVVLDDVHWLDLASLRLLACLADTLNCNASRFANLWLTYCVPVTRRTTSSGGAPHRWTRPLGAVGTGLLAGAGIATTFSDTPTLLQSSALTVVVVLTAALAWQAETMTTFLKKVWQSDC